MKKFIASIDAGTTSNRSILFDLKGKPVFSSQKEFTQYFPKNGWVEHDPEEIWKTTIKTLRDVIQKAEELSVKEFNELPTKEEIFDLRASVAERADVGVTGTGTTSTGVSPVGSEFLPIGN